ncbi:MAG: sensor histidine kinase [Alphaproteobacteria bacterium]|jgi:two-component system phosphate regulon sensor histidine kinase PhoR
MAANKSYVSFNTLTKTVLVVSSPALLVLTLYMVMGYLALSQMLYAYVVIVLATALLTYPFLANVSSLTHYVNELAQDKRIAAPELSFIGLAAELSEALKKLQSSYEVKKKQMETIITEREILVDTLPDILIMVNDEQKIVRTNRAARAIFGQNLAQKYLGDVIPSRYLTDAVTSVIQDLKGREIEFRIEDPMVRDFLAIIERFPVPSAGGITTVITMNDITELKSVEQMRADFVANASHEIRTPLSSIKGFIETLQGPAKDDEKAREEFLGIMLEQADRMKQLIDDLLSLSKIEMNAHSVPTESVELNKIVRAAAEHLKRNAADKNMRLTLNLHDNLPAVKGEGNELTQVANNLISNAIKYGYPDSEVTVTAKITTELPSDLNMRNLTRVVMLAVKDQGEGIPKQHLPRLMERFYRVDSARTRQVGGTGLGLAIVKGIVIRHRGAITIDSVAGEGSTFTVYLPIYEG